MYECISATAEGRVNKCKLVHVSIREVITANIFKPINHTIRFLFLSSSV